MLTFTLFSRRVSLTFGFFFVLALTTLADNRLGVLSLALCVAHELGHLIAMKALGATLTELRFYGGGIKITASRLSDLPTMSQALIYLSGPLVNAAIGLIASPPAGRMSLILAVLNLLPVGYFDGGRLVSLLIGDRAGKILSAIFSCILIFGIFIFALKNPSSISPSSLMTCGFVILSLIFDSI